MYIWLLFVSSKFNLCRNYWIKQTTLYFLKFSDVGFLNSYNLVTSTSLFAFRIDENLNHKKQNADIYSHLRSKKQFFVFSKIILQITLLKIIPFFVSSVLFALCLFTNCLHCAMFAITCLSEHCVVFSQGTMALAAVGQGK